ncbi:MAG: hypothetical protein ACO3XO_02640 [Bdellovibrionota bacterium]
MSNRSPIDSIGSISYSIESSPVSPNELTDDEIGDILEKLANGVQERGLIALAIFFLEAHRPLRAILGQATLCSAPLLGCFFGSGKVQTVLRIMESDDGYEKLITCLEARR